MLTEAVRGAYTPLYASPQQVARRPGQAPDPRDDVHALGVIWYQLITGDLTLTKIPPDWREELQRHGVGPQVLALLGSCLASRAESRPADARALVNLVAEATRSDAAAVVSLEMALVGANECDILETEAAEIPRAIPLGAATTAMPARTTPHRAVTPLPRQDMFLVEGPSLRRPASSKRMALVLGGSVLGCVAVFILTLALYFGFNARGTPSNPSGAPAAAPPGASVAAPPAAAPFTSGNGSVGKEGSVLPPPVQSKQVDKAFNKGK
jgi:hypothetical protein